MCMCPRTTNHSFSSTEIISDIVLCFFLVLLLPSLTIIVFYHSLCMIANLVYEESYGAQWIG